MPGFVSHTVMARDVYKKIDNNKVNLDYMMTYALGGDLCKYAKCRYDSHHKDMDKFIFVMADYIKDNNLINDKDIMGVLYGHICHYIMDSVIHPLVRVIDKKCINNKNNHRLIEEYYDAYLVEERYKISKRDYLKRRIFLVKNNKDINKMLNYVYKEVYDTNNISRYYKFNLFLYRLLSRVYIIFSEKIIKKIIGVNKFLNDNKEIDLVNDNNKIKYKDYLKDDCYEDLLSLYFDSVDMAYEYIKNVNKYLNI